MKQKKFSFAWLYFWIALIIVVGITLCYVYLPRQTEFKITKEECVNRTITENIVLPLHLFSYFDRENSPTESELISACLNINGTIHEDERWEDKKWDFTLYCMIEDFTHEKEVCEDVEVERIFDYEWAVNDERKDRHILIEKDDLTIDWLENNCECGILCSPDYEGHVACKRGICVKYKCGNYYVEVLR